jgi:hypothetical protein
MRTAKYFSGTALLVGLLACISRGEENKPKHDIKEIMTLAHKKGLAKKVIDGKASADEKKELVDLYADLGKNAPPKGDAESWKEKSTAVVKAAKDVEAGKPGAQAALKKAINCAGCHNAHKGD